MLGAGVVGGRGRGASLAGWLGERPGRRGDWLQSLEMAAAMTTVCPAMAMLGAKRPQHVAWQWIVLSLWVVLSLPAAEWLLFAAPPTIHAARRWFLLVLLVPGVVNYLPTRHWPAALLFAAGQMVLLAAYLPGGSLPAGDNSLPALGLIVAAMVVAQRPGGRSPTKIRWTDYGETFAICTASCGDCGWPNGSMPRRLPTTGR